MEQSSSPVATITEEIAKLDGAMDKYCQSQGTTFEELQKAIKQQKHSESKE